MRRKISVLVVMLLMCLSSILIMPDDLKVEASGGGGDGDGEIGLDYDFIWEVTEQLCKVVYNAKYENPNIRKGRAWATEGENYTITNILLPNMDDEDICGLSNITKLQIDYLSDFPKRNYSSKLVTNDFELSISHLSETYPYQNPVPYNETFPVPNAVDCWKCGKVTHNYTFNNIRVLSLVELRERWGENWPFDGTLTNYSLKVSYQNLNDNEMIIGNVSYIANGENLPDDQDGMVFLIDEEAGCEDILANVTHAVGCILLYNDSKGYEYENATDCYFSVARANVSDNEGNLTNITDMLENGEIILVDNVVTPEILTFTYDLLSGQTCYPIFDFFILKNIHAPSELQGLSEFWRDRGMGPQWFDWGIAVGIGLFLRDLNFLPLPNCYGFILYDHINTHFMGPNSRDWWEDDVPGLPMFSVNYSVGNWISENTSVGNRVKVSGYLDQTYKQQNSTTPGVETYNTVGYRNISQSPNDETVVISNRIDGWWGETPGDSGVGCALVLGIAKYFNDYNITPKYNLTFLFTTGEEYGFRGARHFVDSHPENEYNYTLFIGTDQLAFNQIGTNLSINCNNATYAKIVYAIANETNYIERTESKYGLEVSAVAGGRSEDAVWNKTCKTIGFGKDNTSLWDRYHRAGMNYEEGDTLKYTDRDDVNLTFEILWNVTKYFTVNPDCWFSNVTYKAFDSPNDGDTLPDSIRANFTMNTVMPHDQVMVKVILSKHTYGNPGSVTTGPYTSMNYTITSAGAEKSFTFPIPDTVNDGYYSLKLKLYNSTGRINEIVGIGDDNCNDTSDESNIFHLYHPFGYTKIGSNSQSVYDRITGSVFTANEYGVADNITAFINQAFMSPGPYKCMIYRTNDSKLIGTTSEDWESLPQEDPYSSAWWSVFNFTGSKPVLEKDTQYTLTCWGDNEYSYLFYDDSSCGLGRYDEEEYGDPPDPASFSNESRMYSIYCSYTPDSTPPEITNVSADPDTVGFGFNVTISADVTDKSGVDTVQVNITYPDSTTGNFTMNNTENNAYEYIFNDTWLVGQYDYTIWAVDYADNSNSSSGHSFTVSAQATISVCTIKDGYGDNEIINLTDPPSNQPIGYELLDDGDVLRIWNKYDSYYFNTSSGIQLTNHYDEYWSHNVLMLGYYNNDEWNLIYRTDELSGFNKDIDTDDETFVNATLWKDLTYKGYDFRLAIRYHLDVDDNELTVIPYIKNLGEAIPYTLGFAWEINDIQIDMTPEGDYIDVNRTIYLLNQTLDNTYTNLPEPEFYLMENITSTSTRSLYLRWNQSLTYKLQVKSRDGQYNAPVTLFVRIGTLNAGQEKHTMMYWYDADQETYYFDSYDFGEAWASWGWYMVDGNSFSYASTSINGDVELCDGNSCPGSDFGVISMVEIRTSGYYSGSPRNIILRPVFEGIIDGMDYIYEISGAGPAWSPWFDITYDPFAPPSWNWIDVDNLDCDVEVGPGMFEFTLYCSKVEIRATYATNDPPEISNPYPSDGSTGISISPVLNITVFDPDGDTMDITWYSNSSGSWQVFGSNNNVGDGTHHQTFSNAIENGKWWYWKVNVDDGTDYTESSVYKFYTGYQSKIKNTGSTDIKGYLLIQVHYYNETSAEWIVADDTVNESSPRTINLGEHLALDTIFNGLINTNDLTHGDGTYRVYAAFRDPDENILKCDDETEMVATYEFTITFD